LGTQIVKLFTNRKPPLLGLDIGSATIKLVELSRHGDRYCLEHYAQEALSPGAVVDKNINDVEAVAAALQRILKTSNSKLRDAAVAIGGPAVISKIITMPESLNEAEMEEQIVLEADQHLSFPIEEVNIDFQVIGPASTPTRVDVLLAASRTEHVDNLVDALGLAGLHARVVDIEAFALENAATLNAAQLPDQGRDHTIALVDMGASMVTINVMNDMQGEFVREQMFGTRELVTRIANHTQQQEGEVLRRLGREAIHGSEEVIRDFCDEMAGQVQRGLQYYFATGVNLRIDMILISGGIAAMPGMAERIGELNGIETRIANPFAGVDMAAQITRASVERIAPSFMIAMGLALRGFPQ
jgi:type IV pilus assembly protein PilM